MEADLMIFIVGSSRSGTTMMGRILNKHSEVHTFKEIHFFEQLYETLELTKEISSPQAINLYVKLLRKERYGFFSKVTREELLEPAKSLLNCHTGKMTPIALFEHFLRQEAKTNGKLIPCEQTPRNILYCKDILELYPSAKIIHMVRDPRDVMLSQKRKWKRRNFGAKPIPFPEKVRSWTNYHPLVISKLWKKSVDTADLFREHERCSTISYEELLRNPKEVVSNLCEFLELKFNPSLLEISQMGSSHAIDQNKKMGIDSSRTGQWVGGLTQSEVYVAEKVCFDTMNKHGYKASQTTYSIGVLFQYITVAMKLTLALFMNLHRFKNLAYSIKKRL